MTEPTPARVDLRVLALLALLNVLVHFIPLARPGFQPDDFLFLHRARVEPAWSFVEASLSQPTRPLGFLLFILLPYLLGLSEPAQLTVLITTTTLLTVLTYVLLVDLLPRPVANLAALAFVVWPVKHEMYASQLFGVNNLAGVLIVAAALFYRRWSRNSRPLALVLAVCCYGLSILIYELGYLAPLLFWLLDSKRPRATGAAWFLLPAGLYWVLRFTAEGVPMGGGLYPLSASILVWNVLTSLPSNLVGFQLWRNIGYGAWGVISGPGWFQLWVALMAVETGWWVRRWINEAQHAPEICKRWSVHATVGLAAAVLLLAPAAMILVESRQSILAAIGMGAAVASLAVWLRPWTGTAIVLTLLLSTQGLALRQAEASRLQAAVYDVLKEHRDEIRAAGSVVIDMDSLASRVSYTWGERKKNVLRGYWGIHAFASWGFRRMVVAVIYPRPAAQTPKVRVCAGGLAVSATRVSCERDFATQKPFVLDPVGVLLVDFKTMPLP